MNARDSRRWAIVGVALAGAALLAGCTGMVTPPASPSSSATVTPPSAASTPDVLFDGDCAALFSASEVSAASGVVVDLVAVDPASAPRPFDAALTQLGGISCSYDEVATGERTSWFAVVPADRISVPAAADPYCYGTDVQGDGQGACSFAVEASGISLSGVVYSALGTTNVESRAAVDALVSSFTATAATVTVPEGFVPAGTPWQTVTDCGMLVDAADLTAVLSAPGLVGGAGDGVGELALGGAAAATAAGFVTCAVQTPDGSVSLTVDILPGGAWVAQSLADSGAKAVTIDGLDAAFVTPTGLPNVAVIDGFAGGNWIAILPSGVDTSTERCYPALTALAATLG
jgi:hypothetical protein